MVVTESAMESAFSKPRGHSYKHESFAINGSEEVCTRACFW